MTIHNNDLLTFNILLGDVNLDDLEAKIVARMALFSDSASSDVMSKYIVTNFAVRFDKGELNGIIGHFVGLGPQDKIEMNKRKIETVINVGMYQASAEDIQVSANSEDIHHADINRLLVDSKRKPRNLTNCAAMAYKDWLRNQNGGVNIISHLNELFERVEYPDYDESDGPMVPPVLRDYF